MVTVERPRRTLSITVLAGGPSAEREVSLESGKGISEALRAAGHQVRTRDISADDLSALDESADLVFPALHGTFGEDGTLQRLLEDRGIRFVGSGSRASATAMDKVASKQAAREIDIRTPEFALVTRESTRPPWSKPVVVKPVDQGSSVLTSIVREPQHFEPALNAVLSKYGRALVEDFVAGGELTVGVLGNQPLPPICIRPKRGFYDYAAKYQDAATEYLFDTHSPQVVKCAQEWSLRIFERIGCRHLARVDWIVDAHERLWFLEINTLPGFTSHSLLPKAAARVGIPYGELCERLVRMAMEGAHEPNQGP